MKTKELIDALAADGFRPPTPAAALTRALVPAVALAFCLFFAALGLRPHILSFVGEPRFVFKILLMGLLAALCGMLVLRMFRPGAALGKNLLLLASPALFLAGAIGAELIALPAAQWGERLIGSNALFCLKSIPFLGAAPLLATLAALRNGAPEHPALAGAAAGLFAGAIGAAIYALHCPDDSPLFLAVWYLLAIAGMTALGATLGARLLRW